MFTDNSTFILLYTNDLEQTKNFYNALKADLVEEEINKVVYRLGGNELHFINTQSLPSLEYNYNNIGTLGQGVLIYVGATDIQKTFTTISKIKPTNITNIIDNQWESREFMFEDNNGYKFVIYEDLLEFEL